MVKKIFEFVLIVFLLPLPLIGQYAEVEPNDSRENANMLSLGDSSVISATFSLQDDIDYFVVEWQKDRMYYLTSIENAAGVFPNIDLYMEGNPSNVLTSNVGGRNGNDNFRLSGYVPKVSGRYYVQVFNDKTTTGPYKVRLAGGRGPELSIHEPDNSIFSAASLGYLAEQDTVYGAIYPANDVDYYKISGTKGDQFTIGTIPVLDLEVRDTDSYIVLSDIWGTLIAENDDAGSVNTPSGSVNCTFSKMTGIFPNTGDYYISVRSFYNTDFNQSISESNPPMGEYGLYYVTEQPDLLSRYPHVEMPTISSVLVQWNTTVPQPTQLLWGPDEACANVIHQSEPVLNHLVKISGLNPATRYYYRTVNGEDSTDCEYFYTAKPVTTKQVKFFVIGDSSPYAGFGSTPEQLQVAGQIQQVDYDFGLHAGDVNQHVGEEYDLVFYEPYRDILKNAPIFPCIGNHDRAYDNAQTYLASFNLPHNNPDSTERYYSFNYGNAHFISLDTNLPYYQGSPQYKWFKADLESEMRKQTMWTFVYFHHPPWSEGWPGYPGEANVQTYLVPLFEQYKVDMIFNGHTHDYERGILNGVCYIITGGGGCTLEDGIQAYDYEHVTVWINQHHFTYIQLDDNRLKLQAINKEGQLIDELDLEKSVSDVAENDLAEDDLPEAYQLHHCYPNPFNSSTRITFDLKEAADIRLSVYDVNGRSVRTLVDGRSDRGRHDIEWNGTNDAGELGSSGVYFIRLETPDFTQTRRAVFLK